MSKHCIWLTFNSIELEDIIHNLAQRYNGPVFQPHCTLIGKTDIPIVKLKSAILNIRSSINVSEIEIERINFSDKYWQSCYLEVKESDILIELREQLIELLSLEKSENYLPHISLMYNFVPSEMKRKIELPIELGTKIQSRSLQITEWGIDVENWKPIFELMLNN